MKKIIFLQSFLFTVLCSFAQTDSFHKIKPVARPVNMLPATIRNESVNKKQPQSIPDLRVVVSSARYYAASGQSKPYLEVNYVVRNVGTGPAEMNGVGLQGFVYGDATNLKPGCGTSLSAKLLNPGEEMKGSFKCFKAIDRNIDGSYQLIIDDQNSVKELDETNNKYSIGITF